MVLEGVLGKGGLGVKGGGVRGVGGISRFRASGPFFGGFWRLKV